MAIDRRQWLLGAGACALGASQAAQAQQAANPNHTTGPTPTLDRLHQRGVLTVAVYQDMAPFYADGKGIEVELAEALAKGVGLKASLLPFLAGENMDDDLRNMVWKGHYLGFGPADVMLHVPVDRPLMQANPKVEIFGPFWRERVLIARDLKQAPRMDTLDDLKGKKIAVPGQSLAGWLLIGADNGAYREQLQTTAKSGVEAAQALLRGEVAAAAALGSELESTLGKDERFAIEPLPLPRMRDGWPVGMAVKAEATDLAHALQAALNELARSGELAAIFARGRLTWHRP
jgi:ABC-type amino acid transport substrate-binding protein